MNEETKVVPSIFDHPLFKKNPALASLKDIQEPKPEHVRACLMEMARHLIRLEERMASAG